MILPLQDRNNPLYGLIKRDQCLKLINWQNQGLKPWEIFSLYEDYTEEDIKQAYRHLAMHFHPDRNPDVRESQAAFNLIKDVSDYLHYGLKSSSAKNDEFNAIRNNPFYGVYGESGFTQSHLGSAFGEFQSAFYFDEFGNAHFRATTTVPKKKSFNEMSFQELATEAQKRPISPEVVDELKRFILRDKAWLTFPLGKQTPSQTLLHVVTESGDVEFCKWLIEQGADPWIMVNHEFRRGYFDTADYAVADGHWEIFQYLFHRYGTTPFYDQTSDGLGLSPQWRRLEDALEYSQPIIARFLLNEIGYAQYLGNQEFNGFSSLSSSGDKSATVALILEYGLWDDLEIEKSFCKAVEEGELAIAQQILDKKPEISIRKIFEAYLYSHNRASKESLEWIMGLLDSRPITAKDLANMLEDLAHLLNRHLAYVKEQHRRYRIPREHVSMASRDMALALITKLSILLQASEMLPGSKVAVLHYVYAAVAESAAYETLAKLLLISSEPIHDERALLSTLFSAINAARDLNDEAMKRTIRLLINEGGTALIQPNNSSSLLDEDPDNRYRRYTPLHLLCDMGFQEEALHLIAKMREEGWSFDALALKKERQPGQNSFTQYQYTSLHLAIAKGHEELAINLIEAGADIGIKAIIERSPTYFSSFFSNIERIEKTPLEMAIELHQTEVIRKIQLMMLDDYIIARENEEEYLSDVTVCGYTLFRFGHYSKADKLEEALALREILLRGELNTEDLDRLNHGPLSQGRLGQIARLSHHLKNSAESPVREDFNI